MKNATPYSNHARAGAVLLAGVSMLVTSVAADETFEIVNPSERSVAPFVPTVEEDVELMLDVANVGPGDYLIDLGAGDGRIVIAAARRGAFAHGVEIEPEVVELARRNAREAGVTEQTMFIEGDALEADFAEASVVTLYLFPEGNLALRPRLLAELRPGSRVVSNSFDMDDWRPDVHDMSARSSGGVLLWIIPADVAGDWTIEIDGAYAASAAAPYTLQIAQKYQEIDLAWMSAAEPDSRSAAAAATLRGDRILFRIDAGGRHYAFAGRVVGDAISGYVQISGDGAQLHRWRAVR